MKRWRRGSRFWLFATWTLVACGGSDDERENVSPTDRTDSLPTDHGGEDEKDEETVSESEYSLRDWCLDNPCKFGSALCLYEDSCLELSRCWFACEDRACEVACEEGYSPRTLSAFHWAGRCSAACESLGGDFGAIVVQNNCAGGWEGAAQCRLHMMPCESTEWGENSLSLRMPGENETSDDSGEAYRRFLHVVVPPGCWEIATLNCNGGRQRQGRIEVPVGEPQLVGTCSFEGEMFGAAKPAGVLSVDYRSPMKGSLGNTCDREAADARSRLDCESAE